MCSDSVARGKLSLLESLSDLSQTSCACTLFSLASAHVILKYLNQTKIKGGCQWGSKVVPHDSKSDLPLATLSEHMHKKAEVNQIKFERMVLIRNKCCRIYLEQRIASSCW